MKYMYAIVSIASIGLGAAVTTTGEAFSAGCLCAASVAMWIYTVSEKNKNHAE